MRGLSRATVLSLATAVWIAPAAAQRAVPESRLVVAGWIERVTLPEHGIELEAKLDTGADTSSIDARDIERFRKGGVSYARFLVPGGSGGGARIEAPVVRRATIKRAGGESDRRLVVKLRLCLAGQTVEAEVTLADRSQMSVPMLIGRNVLAGRLLVDSEAERRTEPVCSGSR